MTSQFLDSVIPIYTSLFLAPKAAFESLASVPLSAETPSTLQSILSGLNGAWTTARDIWDQAAFGFGLDEFLLATLIFLAFLSLRSLITNLILNRITALASRTQNTIDDAIVEAIKPPFKLVPVVLGIIAATSVLTLDEDAEQFIANLDRSLIALAIFWSLYRASGPMAELMEDGGRAFLTPDVLHWVMRAIRVAFIIVGAATILEVWGIAVGPLVAGLGLFGVAVALGAQDLFKNLIGGLFIIGERRFHRGDWIHVDGVVEGTVEQIGFRTTTVVRFDKAPVYVPNADLAQRSVTNFSRMSARRIKWVIGLRYDTSAESMKAIRADVEAFLLADTRFVQPEETSTFVRFDAFGASSIDLLLYCFTRTTNWIEWLEIKEELLLTIKEIVARHGSDFAFPSRSLYVEALGADMEAFPRATSDA